MQLRGVPPRSCRYEVRGTRFESFVACALTNRIHACVSVAYPQCGLDRFNDTRTFGGRNAEAILHHLEPVLRLRMDARVALALEQLQDFRCGKILRDIDRERHDQPRIAGLLRPCLQVCVNGIGIVAPYRAGAAAAIELRGAGEQQLQVVGEFRHRADSRA